MLKSCCDCLFGNNTEQPNGGVDVVYRPQLNGDSASAPLWQTPREDEIMFVLPRKLNLGDQIDLTGKLKNDPRMFSIKLIAGNTTPDYQNIAFQFEALLPTAETNYQDKFLVNIVKDGVVESVRSEDDFTPTDLLTDSNFKFTFKLKIGNSYEDTVIDISLQESSLQQFRLKHDLYDLRFLTINGDVENINSLNFQFS